MTRVRSASRRMLFTRLSKLGAEPPGRRPRQCRACLAEGELTKAGYCEDEQACQERQPRLFGGDDDDA